MWRYDTSNDVAFLLQSLHRRYPEAVPASSVRTWTADPDALRTTTFSRAAAFESAKPVRPPSTRSSGSGGSSRGFGGGSSSGGGGGGGGW